jgi:hypothetical protein
MNPALLSRRTFLRAAGAGLAAQVLPLRPAYGLQEPTSPFVKRVVRSPENSYFTYPHANGFLADGASVLAMPASGPAGPHNPDLDYLSFYLTTGESRPLTSLKQPRMYYAVAASGLMAYVQGHGVYVVDLAKPNPRPRQVFRDTDWNYNLDCDISVDGRTVLVSRYLVAGPRRGRADAVDVATGRVTTLFEADWLVDHVHFSPFDPEWISFCCGEPKRYMRMWVWHKTEAPDGRRVFEQLRPDGTYFDVGHERAMFDKRASLVVAYGSNSTAKPCGLYEVGFDGSVRLVSESMRDLHCNVSRDGRWAVVSLQGTHELLQQRISGLWLDPKTGYGFSDVMIVNMKTGARQFLYRGTNGSKGQPYEVQPTISPDGRWVILKDGRERCVIGVEIDEQRLSKFLG